MKRIFHVVALTTVLAVGAQDLSAQDFDKGVAAYASGDYATALQEWRLLAEEGDAVRQYLLGELYANGKGTLQDYAEAAKWYRKAAEQGHAGAQANLGWMYVKGKGITQNYAEAVKLYRKAAEQGIKRAQANLGWMYDNGHGVIQDNVYAHMWYNIAASLGSKDASENRDRVAVEMTRKDVSKAQTLARECVAKNYKGC